jgi:hypothetical protein
MLPVVAVLTFDDGSDFTGGSSLQRSSALLVSDGVIDFWMIQKESD